MRALTGALIVLAAAMQPADPASAIVRSRIPIVLSIPPEAETTGVLMRVLQAAGVPHGIEQAPAAASGPVDFARQPERQVRLDGLPLRDALDAIVREDPRYEWRVANGRVHVRAVAVGGASVLDARVRNLRVARGSAEAALTALSHAIDRSRPQPTRGTFGMSVSVGDTAGPPAPAAAEPAIALDVNDASVLEVLDDIARQHGALSWSVNYAGLPGPDTASITLMVPGAFLEARSAAAHEDADRMRTRLMVPIVQPIDGMLTLYARRARLRLGLELLPREDMRPAAMRGMLDLTGVPPAEAVSRIVAYDSRYEWSMRGDLIAIRPRVDLAAAHALDQRIESFVVSDANVEALFTAMATVLGARIKGGGSSEGGLADVDRATQARLIAAGRAKTVTLSLRDRTLRDILDAISREHGTLSWQFEPKGGAGYEITFASYDGWDESRTFEPAK